MCPALSELANRRWRQDTHGMVLIVQKTGPRLHSRPWTRSSPREEVQHMDHEPGAEKRKSEPVISKAIEALLDRHGVPERKRRGALEAAAGMGYQQVRRRMTGETPWNVDEIQRLAAHFGEPLFKLL